MRSTRQAFQVFMGPVLGLALALAGSVDKAGAETPVDIELVLAVDVSLSMDLDEQRLQRDGYVAALRDPDVQRAITAGPNGRIAITFVEWAGRATQNVVVPWTLIESAGAARALADRLDALPISRARMTSISSALLFSGQSFETSGYRGLRRVIDISGDGPNNDGPAVTGARDELVAKGITINALPIMLKAGRGQSLFDIPDLDLYYKDCVIGGQGAFVIPITRKDQVIPAIRNKLLLEISGLTPAVPRSMPAQSSSTDGAPADCLIGEKLWERYMRGRTF
jgi:hypothetical protein